MQEFSELPTDELAELEAQLPNPVLPDDLEEATEKVLNISKEKGEKTGTRLRKINLIYP